MIKQHLVKVSDSTYGSLCQKINEEIDSQNVNGYALVDIQYFCIENDEDSPIAFLVFNLQEIK